MKRIYYIGFVFVISLSLFSCKKDWLEREPKNILTDDQVWNDPKTDYRASGKLLQSSS